MTTKTKKNLNSQNYYDSDTDFKYLSATVFKDFEKCESKALAKLTGEFKEDNIKALLIGNYLHSYFESDEAHQEFIDKNSETMYTKKGTLYKDYSIADQMINTLSSDDMFNNLYQGDKEVIVTGQINGVDWKGKIDCLNLERGYFLDLKTTQDIHKKYWNNETREWQSFVAEYNYPLQMYVYRELIHQQFNVWCNPYIIAVSKQEIPDKQIISIPNYRLENAKYEIEENQQRVIDVMNGITDPESCGQCEYCRQHKELKEIVSMDELLN
ncbi:PD-(D/E)XK nuclease-like domain-containing protein [Companilactobacillus metriopterae]|uniref:PD-(D/E)XK nuclease-like domain-containing protein n=1 Tax=Companilactobacillus metriopterae TaxID=1909267 RepID=UPI00100A8590|nr:PD-(D/E)XK nuclease-like domain-containing protein [Companilactobacillus metriopterae]